MKLGPEIALGRLQIKDVRVEWVRSLADPDQIYVEVRFAGIDIRFDEERVIIATSPPIGIGMDDAFKASYARSYVRDAFLHEIDEWLRVDGDRVGDPHPSPFWIVE